ncbi:MULTISPECIES: bifunctional chorismate mutase/prephenate dehydrogenase [unclassified Shewanella]|uniref:bifunctional chorismate mutase/prephenate dehydrogenase n=1 Tax=unclassified Shewanella TaxID=196818 RepID=UPI000C857015|nr:MULTISPECIES: bifunctional chorismate mutase/prephenate dehydrogenase [unclassified Shewanella]MDO6617512.1 bifunctional chorismate mutase/prephenate dehydrogenase [Shewanella sp. 6_MG-2023]MDO6638757.1 bifunctional chorismate mutase/prephenate dehydrogenase [Shewanella sp. 5_MG-2023]MDO6677112.1 bifunctional chorismate mutase/prephenate dehydrogenase [Shewanella sp. 4_MG-2023]MDO6773775.1 bifunctional chorismate mutase/prephenate dehydrogenase [Shewanella sp. 3_MG-2023]PMG43172.1 bifunctio
MNEKTTLDLDNLRELIDGVDQQLLHLLRKRLDLVAQVGAVKHAAGVPIYAPQREASMLAKRRKEASEMDVSPQLIEDILRRLMRESYLNEKDVGFKQVKTDLGHIVIVGGEGQLGGLFSQMLTLSGYTVKSLDKNDWHRADELFDGAGMVIVTVPINVTCEVISNQLNNLADDCILADLTSIKTEPLNAMLAAHNGPVVGLHPMFGPDVGSLAKQVVVVCDGREPQAYQWLLDQIIIWGARIVNEDAQKHDKAMQLVQAMRHFSTFVYGLNLCKEQADIETLLQFSSPIYRLELAMVGRLFAQDPKLYADIIFAQEGSQVAISDYLDNYGQALQLLKTGNRDEFVSQFEQVAKWFGDFAPQFQQESRAMLQSVNDMKTN